MSVARSAAGGRPLEPYANNGCNIAGGPQDRPANGNCAPSSVPSPHGRWNPRAIFRIDPGASLALGYGEPRSEATAVHDAVARGYWTEIADYYDFRTRARKDGTLGGRKRAHRLRYCGRLRSAMAVHKGEEIFGTNSRACGDRMCPSCQAGKARTDARLLRTYYHHRQEARAGATSTGYDSRFLFLTLTDVKARASDLNLEQSLESLLGIWRTCTNAGNRKNYRAFRRYVAGGLRVVEVTHSARGQQNRDGSVVKYTGWHPHLHVICELTEPPAGVSHAEWARRFEDWLTPLWCEHSRGASPAGQKFLPVDSDRVGQLTKYCVKPFSVGKKGGREVAAECMQALNGRRMAVGFGDWKSWKRTAEDLQPARPGAIDPAWLSTSLLEWDVQTEIERHTVLFVSPDNKTSAVRDWDKIREQLQGDSRTVYQKVQARLDGLRDSEIQEARERIALMVAVFRPVEQPPGSAALSQDPATSEPAAAGLRIEHAQVLGRE